MIWLVLIWSALARGACEPAEFLVALDPGHSNADPGAISARGVEEVVFNRNLAQLVQETLQQRGFATRVIDVEALGGGLRSGGIGSQGN